MTANHQWTKPLGGPGSKQWLQEYMQRPSDSSWANDPKEEHVTHYQKAIIGSAKAMELSDKDKAKIQQKYSAYLFYLTALGQPASPNVATKAAEMAMLNLPASRRLTEELAILDNIAKTYANDDPYHSRRFDDVLSKSPKLRELVAEREMGCISYVFTSKLSHHGAIRTMSRSTDLACHFASVMMNNRPSPSAVIIFYNKIQRTSSTLLVFDDLAAALRLSKADSRLVNDVLRAAEKEKVVLQAIIGNQLVAGKYLLARFDLIDRLNKSISPMTCKVEDNLGVGVDAAVPFTLKDNVRKTFIPVHELAEEAGRCGLWMTVRFDDRVIVYDALAIPKVGVVNTIAEQLRTVVRSTEYRAELRVAYQGPVSVVAAQEVGNYKVDATIRLTVEDLVIHRELRRNVLKLAQQDLDLDLSVELENSGKVVKIERDIIAARRPLRL